MGAVADFDTVGEGSVIGLIVWPKSNIGGWWSSTSTWHQAATNDITVL